MKKRWYIITIVLVALGVIVGGFLENKRVTGTLQDFSYVNDAPVLFNISEQEMNIKPQLADLIEKYGVLDESSKKAVIKKVPKDQKELAALLPEGSIVKDFLKKDSNIEVYYDLNDISYHMIYMETHVQKCVTVTYKDKKYTIINTDNKEFDLSK